MKNDTCFYKIKQRKIVKEFGIDTSFFSNYIGVHYAIAK